MSKAKSRARHMAVQGLYQWQMVPQEATDIVQQFRAEHSGKNYDHEYFADLLNGISLHQAQVDAAISPWLDRDIARVDPVEQAILRMASYEMLFHLEVPYRVIINEAVELAKRFGADQGHKFINAVLDKMARKERAAEIQAKK